jgi:hypothetical protein
MARQSNGKGTLVDTWYWDFPGIDLVGSLGHPEADEDEGNAHERAKKLVKGQKIPVEVRILKHYTGEGGAQQTPKAVEFSVSCPALNLSATGTDIEALRVAMWSMLEKTYKIQWERYLIVAIGNAHGFQATVETGFALGTSSVWKGVAPDGTIILREFDHGGNRFSNYKYRPWPGEYSNKDGNVLACIPATEKNEAAIEQFRASILTLKERLQELVKPEQILQTLENLSNIAMLPAPSDDSLRKARKFKED